MELSEIIARICQDVFTHSGPFSAPRSSRLSARRRQSEYLWQAGSSDRMSFCVLNGLFCGGMMACANTPSGRGEYMKAVAGMLLAGTILGGCAAPTLVKPGVSNHQAKMDAHKCEAFARGVAPMPESPPARRPVLQYHISFRTGIRPGWLCELFRHINDDVQQLECPIG